MSLVAGPADIVIVFDGRCRPMRRVIEDALSKGGVTPDELWITFKAPPKSEAGKGNDVLMGADSHELAYVRLPKRRQNMAAKPRKDFCPDGANSTHSKTFSNVGLPVKARLPRISKSEKPLAFSQECLTHPTPISITINTYLHYFTKHIKSSNNKLPHTYTFQHV